MLCVNPCHAKAWTPHAVGRYIVLGGITFCKRRKCIQILLLFVRNVWIASKMAIKDIFSSISHFFPYFFLFFLRKRRILHIYLFKTKFKTRKLFYCFTTYKFIFSPFWHLLLRVLLAFAAFKWKASGVCIYKRLEDKTLGSTIVYPLALSCCTWERINGVSIQLNGIYGYGNGMAHSKLYIWIFYFV